MTKRECGSCYACCVVTEIDTPKLVKKAGVACPKLDLNLTCGKCSIHEKKELLPQVCSDFECLWKDGYGKDWDQPNRSGIVGMVRDFSGGHWVLAIETKKDAARNSGRETLIELSRKFDIAVIVQLFDSKNVPFGQAVIKNSILHRATAMMGDFIEWLDTDETIGLYKLPHHKFRYLAQQAKQ